MGTTHWTSSLKAKGDDIKIHGFSEVSATVLKGGSLESETITSTEAIKLGDNSVLMFGTLDGSASIIAAAAVVTGTPVFGMYVDETTPALWLLRGLSASKLARE